MARFPKPCPTCRTLYKTGGDYCPACQQVRDEKRKQNTPPRKETQGTKDKKAYLYGGRYRAKAKIVRETATHCHLCGKAFQPNDVIHADHLYPELGNQSPLMAAHKRCNESRGNRPLNN